MKLKKVLSFLLTAFILAGCAESESSLSTTEPETEQIVILGNTGKSIFYMTNDNRISRSEFTSETGEKEIRTYSYNVNNDLQMITRQTSIGEIETFYVSKEHSRDDGKITKKTIKQSSSRGTERTLECNYYYDDNGKAKYVIQTDNFGNIQKKSSNIKGE